MLQCEKMSGKFNLINYLISEMFKYKSIASENEIILIKV